MIDDVLGIPDQLRDALWRIESARLEAAPGAGLFVCGMGASAPGGGRRRGGLRGRPARPSCPGPTEEPLAACEAAEALGARRLVASIGGPLVERARETGVPVVG